MTCNEIWKDIPGFNGKYQASNLGNIRSMNYNGTNIVKNMSQYNSRGYLACKLTLNGINKRYLVHRLILLTFNGSNEKNEVNHKDGNKHNNKIDNLEWCTRSENILHAYRTGLKIAKSGDEHPKSKSVYRIKDDKIIKKYNFIYEAEHDGFSHSKIVLCCQGKRKHHKGYEWKYAS